MRKSGVFGVALFASLLMAEAATTQVQPRQAPPRQVSGDTVVVPPVVRSFNVAQLTLPQRTTVARQLTGSSTLTAGTTQRYGHGTPTPNSSDFALYDPSIVFSSNGIAIFSSATNNGGVIGRVMIKPFQESGLLLFECPVYSSAGLTWRTRVGTSSMFTEGIAPVANQRSVFVVDMTGLLDKTVEITGLPRGTQFGFSYCDVTTLSG